MSDDRTPYERELDMDIANMSASWSMGLRGEDYPAWHDGGMNWVNNERQSEAGRAAGLAGRELAEALHAMELKELAAALALSRTEVSELNPDDASYPRRISQGSNQRPWTRLLYDGEREVFVALADNGVEIAPIEVEWESPGKPVSLIRASSWTEWNLHQIWKAIDAATAERRRTYATCPKCRRPRPPEHFGDAVEDGECDYCAEEGGAVF